MNQHNRQLNVMNPCCDRLLQPFADSCFFPLQLFKQIIAMLHVPCSTKHNNDVDTPWIA
jgi:hypothetical protein